MGLLPIAAMNLPSVYARSGRAKFYVSFDCPATARRLHRATPFRTDDPEGGRKALAFAAALAKPKPSDREYQTEAWETWVPAFLRQQYRRQQKSLQRYLISWKWWRLFLSDRKISTPRALTFQHVRDFHEWRTTFKKRSGRSVSHNTALLDVKAMQVVMNEARRREWVAANPCDRLGIGRATAKVKPEITDAEMATIIAELDALVAREPGKAWMRTAWEIARWQGCRLRETRLDLARQVDLRDGTIVFNAKGRHGNAKVVPTWLHDGLRPLLARMIADKQAWTCDPIGPLGSLEFRRFFHAIGLPHLCFHCTRVTVITKGARAGVPESHMMAYVGHSKSEVHRIYQRFSARDLIKAAAAVSYAGGTPSTAENPGCDPASP